MLRLAVDGISDCRWEFGLPEVMTSSIYEYVGRVVVYWWVQDPVP